MSKHDWISSGSFNTYSQNIKKYELCFYSIQNMLWIAGVQLDITGLCEMRLPLNSFHATSTARREAQTSAAGAFTPELVIILT